MLRNLNRTFSRGRILGTPKTGVLGALIAATGDRGPGYCYKDLSFPADSNKEIRGLITRRPTLGTLVAYEDTGFTYDGETDSFDYQLYVNDVKTGPEVTVGLNVGSPTVTLSLTTGSVFSGSASVAGGSPEFTLSIIADSVFTGDATVIGSSPVVTMSIYAQSIFAGNAGVYITPPVFKLTTRAESIFVGFAKGPNPFLPGPMRYTVKK